jgi:polyisoprenoid-binding protein YceI
MMATPPGQVSAPAWRTLLEDGSLTGEWELDPRESSVRLRSKNFWGLLTVSGVFREVRGSGRVSADGQVTGTLTVAAASVDTKNSKRDQHLRSADFFDSDNNPDITFTMAGLRPSDQGVAVNGSLTVRGRTRPLSLDAAAFRQDNGNIRLEAEIVVNRADFDLTWNQMGMTAMDNTITVTAIFARR